MSRKIESRKLQIEQVDEVIIEKLSLVSLVISCKESRFTNIQKIGCNQKSFFGKGFMAITFDRSTFPHIPHIHIFILCHFLNIEVGYDNVSQSKIKEKLVIRDHYQLIARLIKI